MRKNNKLNRAIILFQNRRIFYSNISIDPGTQQTGWCFTSCFLKGYKIQNLRITSGTIKLKGEINNRLSSLKIQIEKLLLIPSTRLIIESPFVNKNWSTSITLGYARGVIISLLFPFVKEIKNFSSFKLKRFCNGFIKEEAATLLKIELGIKCHTLDESDAVIISLIDISENMNQTRFLNAANDLRTIYID